MNELIVEEKRIEDMIYEIRGKQVMLDSDLAKLYKCKNGTKDINKAVKRNLGRFPEDFYFELTFDECSRFQIGTLNMGRGSNIKYLPHVFTEQGVAMLASVLHTEVAEYVSVSIMRAFVNMKKYISNSLIEQQFINNLVLENYDDIKLIKESLLKLEDKSEINSIFFKGQIYDSYSKIIDIISKAKKELIIIDAYADKTILDIISRIKCNVILICKTKSLLSQTDIEKYNKQYNNLKIIYNDTFHDRYFILDKSILYHCGTSLNHIGEKTFSINKIEDSLIIKRLLEEIENL